MSKFPNMRLRRLRENAAIRRLVAETALSVSDLIYPIFVTHGRDKREPIPPMPGVNHLSLDKLLDEIEEVVALGIPGVILFGLPARKDDIGSEAYDQSGVIQEAARVIKKTAPGLLVVTDVCLCQYTTHGHCGIVSHGGVDNDATIELYAKVAVSHARSGVDVVAPSGMMDGQVQAIRHALDDAGYTNLPIMAYAAKHASAFYGPFRVAADSSPQYGDRQSYQLNPANSRMALREVIADIEEGADFIMVKPALAYLDIIARVRQDCQLPIVAYNVSGEYSLIKAAAANGWISEKEAVLEMLIGMKRAGADVIITYHAKDAAAWLEPS